MKHFKNNFIFGMLLVFCVLITSACGDSYGSIDYYNPNFAYGDGSLIIYYDNDPKEVVLDNSVIDKLYKIGVLAKNSANKKELKEVNIPEIFTYNNIQYKIVALEDNIFENCSLLEKVTLPDSIEKIGDYAFCWCRNLEEIDLPDSIEEIGVGAFKNCSFLRKIKIPYKVRKIERNTFQFCHYLNKLTFGNRITEIGDNAFEECDSLTEITLPSSLVEIGSSAFEQCTSLKSVIIQDGLRVINDKAFYNCYRLTLYIPDSVITIRGYSTLYEVDFYYNGTATGSPWGGNKLE
jgi:hypothetical protein